MDRVRRGESLQNLERFVGKGADAVGLSERLSRLLNGKKAKERRRDADQDAL